MGEKPAPPAERPRPSMLAAEALLLLAVAGLWLSSALVGALQPDGGSMFAMDLVYYAPFVLMPVVFYCLRVGGLSDALRLNPLPLMPAVLIALAGLMSVYAASAVNGLWTLLLDALGFAEPQVSLQVDSSRDLMLAVLHTAAIPAVCEELLCRGVVFSAFERKGTARAIWISALFFGLMHGNLYGLPAYVLVGAMAAFIVYAVDSLYAGMFYHTVYNAAVLVILHRLSGQEAAQAAAGMSAASMAAALVLDLAMVGASLLMILSALNLRRRAAGILPAPRARAPMSGWERALLAALLVAMAASMAAVQSLAGGAA